MHFFLSFALFWSLAFAQDLKLPDLSSPVVDEAGLLSDKEADDLASLAYEIYTNNGPQINLLTVKDLQDYPIEEYSIRVAEKWQLGSKEKGNGLLVLISLKPRKVRIEVGEGIEGEITDYFTTLYTRKLFPQYFKEGRFHEALRIFYSDVGEKFGLKPSANTQRRFVSRRSHSKGRGGLNTVIFLGFIVLAFANMFFRKNALPRGIVSGAGIAGLGWFLIPGLGLAAIFLFIFGFIFGLAGFNNVIGGGRYYGGGGGFGGGGFGGGGGWGGGGGGFSGGGSSGSW